MEAKVGGLVGPGEATWDRHLPGSQVGTKQGRECRGHGLTHPHLSEAALAQLDLQPQLLKLTLLEPVLHKRSHQIEKPTHCN